MSAASTFDPQLGFQLCLFVAISLVFITMIAVMTAGYTQDEVNKADLLSSKQQIVLGSVIFLLLLLILIVILASLSALLMALLNTSNIPYLSIEWSMKIAGLIGYIVGIILFVQFVVMEFGRMAVQMDSLLKKLLIRIAPAPADDPRQPLGQYYRRQAVRHIIGYQFVASYYQRTTYLPIAAGLSFFAIFYPTLNYYLQPESLAVKYIWSEARNGLLTLRFSSISVGIALALVVSRMGIEMMGIKKRLLSTTEQLKDPTLRWLFRTLTTPFTEDAIYWDSRPLKSFKNPYNQAVARIKCWQTIFFSLVLIILWLASLAHEAYVPMPIIRDILPAYDKVPIVLISLVLLFIIDDWYIIEAHLLKMKGGINAYHRVKFTVAFITLILLMVDFSYYTLQPKWIFWGFFPFLLYVFFQCQFLLWNLHRLPEVSNEEKDILIYP